MHASLMRRFARLEVARDNMGHAGSTGSITLAVYSKTWWDERVDAVDWIVEAIFSEPEKEDGAAINPPPEVASKGKDWELFWEPQAFEPDQNSM
jgi:hypothetical protein